ncbi:hypothetical protein [Mesomycoplasma ovipneumoniae]|uniref:hypothetical protein n=1 Tax=Mesomycoplasma ovipneumoniae TaxID=29562 RepID=UPI00311B17E5
MIIETQSVFSKIISNINTNQTTNRNSEREAYTSTTGSQTSRVSRIQTIELDDFAKYTNRILLKKSEIKPLNQIGAYIEMEFDDPKELLAPLKNHFSRAQIQGTNDLAKWIELSSNIRFDNQRAIIKNPGTSNNQSTYKVDATNDDGTTFSLIKNQWTANNSSSYNLDFDVKIYDYNISNPFASLVDNPNHKYVDLIKQIPKVVYPKTTLKENHVRNKFYSLRLAKFEVDNSGINKTVKVGLIITYHHTSIDNFSKKIISIYPKILSNLLNRSGDIKNFEPLVPTFSDKVNLTFMTSPIIQKEDPYWGNFWANPSGNVWHGSEVRKYDKSRGQTGEIIQAFERSIFQKMYNDFHDRAAHRVNHSNTFFIGPTGPVKGLVTGGNQNPSVADPNIAGQIYGTSYADKNMDTWLNELWAKQDRHPFGIKSVQYQKDAKWLRIEFNTPGNAIRSGVRLQEIIPTVSYATFVDQTGKIYLFGNKNGLPIRLQDDINVNDRTLWINLAPANWSEHELPKTGTNLNFMGLLVFPYLPPDFTQNRFLRGDVGGNIYKSNQQYKFQNLTNGGTHKYLLPVKGYDGLQVDAENPYFVPWVSHDNAWLRITY